MLKKETHLEEAKLIYAENLSSLKTAQILLEKYNLPLSTLENNSRKIRKWISPNKKEAPISTVFSEASKKKLSKGSKRYIISAAQNATTINKALFKHIKKYAEFINAEIVIIPYRYRNPTTPSEKRDDEWWDAALHPYLFANRESIGTYLQVLGDVKIQPTATNPLTGLEGLSGLESSIIGHPRQHLKTLPTLEGVPPKILMSTGVVTNKNYSSSKTGKKAEFHHTFGFIVAELTEDSDFYIRHVSANTDGSFYDLDYYVNKETVRQKNNSVSAVVFGDLHLGEHCDESLRCSYQMLKRFQPHHLILHDVMNGHSISHHEKRNPFILLEREKDGSRELKKEIEGVLGFLDSVIQYNPIVVKSNHDDFVDRFLLDADWRKENNKESYLKYAFLKSQGKIPNGVLPYEIEQKFGDRIICLNENQSYMVCGIEVGQHGHLGSGGSRGSALQFKKMNIKMVTAHTHSPLKEDGLVTVGTLTKLRLGYNKGLSNWLNSNVIIHKNGKTQNLLIINGKYSNL